MNNYQRDLFLELVEKLASQCYASASPRVLRFLMIEPQMRTIERVENMARRIIRNAEYEET